MHKRTVVSILSAAVLVGLAVPPNHIIGASAAPAGPRTLPGHVPDAVSRVHTMIAAHHDSRAPMTIAVGLALRDPGKLNAFLRDVNNPASPNFHRFLTQQQANAEFNPTARQETAVVRWLRSNGFTVTHTYPNHLLVDARGTFGQVEKLLKVRINDYHTVVRGKPVQFYAPTNNPTVDASVSDSVQSIAGLDNYPRFHLATNGTAHGAPAYYPQDFANAYDMNPLWNAGYNGTGQNIGITLWTVPPSDTTLQSFGSTTGAAVATTANGKLKVIKVDGGTTTADDGEAGMDIESSGGMAPGATIDYYEAPTDASGNPTDQGLEDSLNQAGTDANNNRQITNSWGGCEASSATDAFTSATNNIFSSNSATGHNYLFSSGDNGSWCAPNGITGQNPYPDYPTSSPYVTSVGGTKFNANIGSTWPGESAWAYCSTCNSGNPEGSGGGYSNIFSRPSWQTGAGLASNGKRGYPDISADADPNTGAYVCYGSSSSCGQIGGTSLASPLWAGILAVINQYLNAQGKPYAGFINSTLYNLANTSQSYAPFHDVTSGTNGSYNAGTAWDAVTGLGSTDAYNLARDMAGTGGTPPTATPTSTTGPTSTPKPTSTTGPGSTPTATSTPSTARQLIVNGGFESGSSSWVESSSGAYELVDTTRPHSGAYSAYLCGYNYCNDQIYQSVTLPSSFSKVTLTYWYYSSTSEASGAPCYDYFRSRIRNSSGTTLTTTQSSCNSSVTNGWVSKSFDVTSAVSGYAGKTVQVYFQGTTDSSLVSSFFVDDVALNVS